MVNLSAVQMDRAMGALVGLACGDALGAGYEFEPRVPYTSPVSMNGGNGWAPGEWTDDTDMATCIAEVAAIGQDLRLPTSQDEICRKWISWAQSAADVGIQTRAVLGLAANQGTAIATKEAAREIHNQHGRSAGNGSLMRTAPVALAYLDDPEGLTIAARSLSDLTHFESDAGDACVLWCHAIRLAVLNGKLPNLQDLLIHLPSEDRSKWLLRVSEASAYESFHFENNGWVVEAFQAALSALVHARIPTEIPEVGLARNQHFQISIERAVRCGNDTDTVGAIAGSLAGAIWGASAAPISWKTKLHGHPNYTVTDLENLARFTVNKGQSVSVELPGDLPNAIEAWSPHQQSGVIADHPLLNPQNSSSLKFVQMSSGISGLVLDTKFGVLQRTGGTWAEINGSTSGTYQTDLEIKVSPENEQEIATVVARFDEMEFCRD